MSHSFLKESKLFIVYGGNKYRIYTTTALSFSQTFAEDSYPVKTLHDQTKMIEGSTITKANPAQFSFSVPLTAEKDESIVMDLISDLVSTVDSGITTQQLKAFDMYVQTGSATFKVASCVVTGADFAFNPREQFKVDVQGQGTQLSRVGNESYTIPGSLQSESSTRTPLLIYPVVSVSGLDMNSILGVTVSIQNDIKWNPFETLHQSLNSTTMFPSAYTVTGRVVSGAIQQYQTDNNITQFDDFDTNTVILVTANKSSDKTPYWTLRINPAMFTARMNVASIYTQTYDFRSLDNTALGTRITQYS
jgi:hypothetical protein|tara:strand:+ start:201 stop:1115 length:915 start_codon:yes stop_codon:yes gene_type:complete